MTELRRKQPSIVISRESESISTAAQGLAEVLTDWDANRINIGQFMEQLRALASPAGAKP